MLPPPLVPELAKRLYEARKNRTQLRHFSRDHPQMTIEDSYAIQREWVKLELADGHTIKGRKIGLTSRAMQQASQITEPDYAPLMNDMFFDSGTDIPVERFIAPRVEVELGFVLEKPLRGPGVTLTDVLQATAYVTPALEIIDSRVADWKIKLGDTVADNASSARIVLGTTCSPVDAVDLRLVGGILEKNGEVLYTAAGAAALGDPAIAVAWLANKLATFDILLRAGEIILPGAVTKASPVERGDTIRATYDRLGSVSVKFV